MSHDVVDGAVIAETPRRESHKRQELRYSWRYKTGVGNFKKTTPLPFPRRRHSRPTCQTQHRLYGFSHVERSMEWYGRPFGQQQLWHLQQYIMLYIPEPPWRRYALSAGCSCKLVSRRTVYTLTSVAVVRVVMWVRIEREDAIGARLWLRASDNQ